MSSEFCIVVYREGECGVRVCLVCLVSFALWFRGKVSVMLECV